MTDLLDRLRGVARFYLASSNMSNTVLHVNTVEDDELTEYSVEAAELLELVYEVKHLRAALREIAEDPGMSSPWYIAQRALEETE